MKEKRAFTGYKKARNAKAKEPLALTFATSIEPSYEQSLASLSGDAFQDEVTARLQAFINDFQPFSPSLRLLRAMRVWMHCHIVCGFRGMVINDSKRS